MRDEEYIGKLIMSDENQARVWKILFSFSFLFPFKKKKILDLKTLISRDEFVSDLKDPTPTYGRVGSRGEQGGRTERDSRGRLILEAGAAGETQCQQ